MIFQNRQEAGQLLAQALQKYTGRKDAIVLGLARGGVVIAYEIAKNLSLPLNVVVPRKIGAPDNPELALGAITDNGEGVFNESIISLLGVSQRYIANEIEKEKVIAQKRLALYRQYAPLSDLKDKIVILVDDGIATGATMLAAIKAMRTANVRMIIVAVPVAATDSLALIKQDADEVVCLYHRGDFMSVGLYFRDFRQVEDSEIVELLKNANKGEVGHGQRI